MTRTDELIARLQRGRERALAARAERLARDQARLNDPQEPYVAAVAEQQAELEARERRANFTVIQGGRDARRRSMRGGNDGSANHRHRQAPRS
jgi:hypothetical protein